MKRILLLTVCVAILCTSSVFAQSPATGGDPFRSLEKWFATQSAPDMLQKAQWALDDINAYRTAMGLTELPETVITATRGTVVSERTVQPRRLFYRLRR